MQISNSISMGPYNNKITFPGQIQRCYICNSTEHQNKDCDNLKCWKCGKHGHKGKECNNIEVCNLCGEMGYLYFRCPRLFSNKPKGIHNEQDIQDNNHDNKDEHWEQHRDDTRRHAQKQAKAQDDVKPDQEEQWRGEDNTHSSDTNDSTNSSDPTSSSSSFVDEFIPLPGHSNVNKTMRTVQTPKDTNVETTTQC